MIAIANKSKLEENSMSYMMDNKATKVVFIWEKRNKYISTPIIFEQLVDLMDDLCDLMGWEMTDNIEDIYSNMVKEDPELVNQILMDHDSVKYRHLLEQCAL